MLHGLQHQQMHTHTHAIGHAYTWYTHAVVLSCYMVCSTSISRCIHYYILHALIHGVHITWYNHVLHCMLVVDDIHVDTSYYSMQQIAYHRMNALDGIIMPKHGSSRALIMGMSHHSICLYNNVVQRIRVLWSTHYRTCILYGGS